MKIKNILQRFSCISSLFKPPWFVLIFKVILTSMFLQNYAYKKSGVEKRHYA